MRKTGFTPGVYVYGGQGEGRREGREGGKSGYLSYLGEKEEEGKGNIKKEEGEGEI